MKRLDYHSWEGKCRNRRRGEGVRCGSEEGGGKGVNLIIHTCITVLAVGSRDRTVSERDKREDGAKLRTDSNPLTS